MAYIWDMVFTPDYLTLISGAQSGSIITWRIDDDDTHESLKIMLLLYKSNDVNNDDVNNDDVNNDDVNDNDDNHNKNNTKNNNNYNNYNMLLF